LAVKDKLKFIINNLIKKQMKLLDEVVAWAKKELGIAGADVTRAEADLLNVATIGSNILEAAKNWVASPLGKTLLSVIEAVPGVGPIAQEVVDKILPASIGALTTIEADASNPEELVTYGLNAIGQKAAADEVAVAYTGVSALITNRIAPLLNVVSTIQTALSVTPSVYTAPKTA
jgi:hypothetical protein